MRNLFDDISNFKTDIARFPSNTIRTKNYKYVGFYPLVLMKKLEGLGLQPVDRPYYDSEEYWIREYENEFNIYKFNISQSKSNADFTTGFNMYLSDITCKETNESCAFIPKDLVSNFNKPENWVILKEKVNTYLFSKQFIIREMTKIIAGFTNDFEHTNIVSESYAGVNGKFKFKNLTINYFMEYNSDIVDRHKIVRFEFEDNEYLKNVTYSIYIDKEDFLVELENFLKFILDFNFNKLNYLFITDVYNGFLKIFKRKKIVPEIEDIFRSKNELTIIKNYSFGHLFKDGYNIEFSVIYDKINNRYILEVNFYYETYIEQFNKLDDLLLYVENIYNFLK